MLRAGPCAPLVPAAARVGFLAARSLVRYPSPALAYKFFWFWFDYRGCGLRSPVIISQFKDSCDAQLPGQGRYSDFCGLTQTL